MGNQAYNIEQIKIDSQVVTGIEKEQAYYPKLSSIIVNPYDKNKLSANIEVVFDRPLKYSYRVIGVSPDVDFTYSSDILRMYPVIPIVGLYANRPTNVNITLEENGHTYEYYIVFLYYEYTDFGDTPLTVNIEVLDADIAENTIKQGWIVDGLHNGYDSNGDLRFTGVTIGTSWLKFHDGYFYFSGEPDGVELTQRIHRANLLGKIFQTYEPPAGYSVHHDLTFDNKGNLYVLGSKRGEGTDTEKVQSHIYKYDIESGSLLWERDYSAEFVGQYILKNGAPNDVHFNSIDYEEKFSQLIVNSRACNAIIGVDDVSGDFQWIIQNPVRKVLDEEKNLRVINPERFQYINGAHTAFITYNSKYSDYVNSPDKMAISIFNNNSCKNPDGSDNVRLMEAPDEGAECYPFDSVGYVYGIDLAAKTVEFLDEFIIEGERSAFVSSVYDIGECYCIYFGGETNFFVLNTNNDIGVRVLNMNVNAPTYSCYRGCVITYPELRKLIDNTYNVINFK